MQIEAPPTARDTPKPQGERRGLVIAHTGNGKGKSTAAFGVAPVVCARVPARWCHAGPALRERGMAVRDCSNFGLPGHWRLNALPAASCAALWRALGAVG